MERNVEEEISNYKGKNAVGICVSDAPIREISIQAEGDGTACAVVNQL